jgi:hypothetical protein
MDLLLLACSALPADQRHVKCPGSIEPVPGAVTRSTCSCHEGASR